jgi:hypothetical protein
MPAWGIAPGLVPFFTIRAEGAIQSGIKTQKRENASRFQRFELAITSNLGRCPRLTN